MNLSTFSFKRWIRVFFLTWVGISAIFLLSSEFLIRIKVEPEDTFEKHRRLFFASDKSNVVFGDSHGAQGFMGAEDFVNLSYASESIEIMKAKVRLYFARHTPRRVVFQADPHLFSDYRIKENVRDYIRLFERPDGPLLQVLTPRHRRYLFHYWAAFILGSDFKSNFRFNADGSQVLLTEEAGRGRSILSGFDLESRVRLQMPRENFKKSESFKQYRDILNYLKERQAEVCLVTFPVSPAYAGEAKRFPEFEEARFSFQDMASTYGFSYASYWDSLEDSARFTNEDHLNEEGAKELTQKIVKDCFGKVRKEQS